MLGDLLRNKAPLAVPKYQRGYSWDLSQVNDYVEDAIGILAMNQADEVHFMGVSWLLDAEVHTRWKL